MYLFFFLFNLFKSDFGVYEDCNLMGFGGNLRVFNTKTEIKWVGVELDDDYDERPSNWSNC